MAINGYGHSSGETGAPIQGMSLGYFIMEKPGQVVDLDFDSQGWFIVNHYIPSGQVDRP